MSTDKTKPSKPRILIYTHAFPPMIGGVETYVMLLAQGLTQGARVGGDDLQITVVTPIPARGNNDAALPFRVVRQPGLGRLFHLIREADVIHLAGPCLLPMLLGLILRRRVSVEHHGYPPICPNGLLVYEPDGTVCSGHFMARRYQECLRCNAAGGGLIKSAIKLLVTFVRRWLVKRVEANICITAHVKDRLRLPRASVLYYGVPTLRDPEPFALSSDPFCFAYVGRLVTLKGLPLLVEAAGRLKKQGYRFRVSFIGDGPERGALEKLVRDCGLCDYISFAGSATGEALAHLIRDVTAVVMPSTWEETAGLSAIEQMMRGRLVIAARIGGLGEVVGEAGLLFPPGDAYALAECMKRVLDNPELSQQLGDKARQRALALFQQDMMVENHLAQWFDTPTIITPVR